MIFTHICSSPISVPMAVCCWCSCLWSSLTSSSFQSVLNFAFQFSVEVSRTPFVIFSMYFSSHVESTRQLVRVVSNVSINAGFSCRTSVSLRSSDWICESEAPVSLSCEQSEDTVTGARFHAVRISLRSLAATTQVVVIRS